MDRFCLIVLYALVALFSFAAHAEDPQQEGIRRGILNLPLAEEEELQPSQLGEIMAESLMRRRGGGIKTGVWLHALSPFGDLKYPETFRYMEYTWPGAPKGGISRQHEVGTFDSLNGFILKGTAAAGIGVIYDTLLEASDDEPFSRYGLLAERVMVAPDLKSVSFRLRPQAKWNDGEPVTAEDVVFTFNLLMEKGHPSYRTYYQDVDRVEVTGEREVTFYLKTSENRELPLILGELPILPEHFWKDKDFTKAGTDVIPLGSGPYRIGAFKPGKFIRYERVKDYWGIDLPINRGRHNFDTISVDYYRDATVALEAFKAGAYDFRLENVARDWARAYDFPALREGRAKKETIPHAIPTGMQAFVFNTRKPIFQDARVREALNYAFDFEWANRTLFYSLYTRNQSYFSNSFYAAAGLPSDLELELLNPLKAEVPEQVFTTAYHTPTSDGNGINRENLLHARDLLQQAGWVVKDGILVNEKTGAPFTFQILLSAPTFERVAAPFLKHLRRLGIQATMRTVDASQYQKRLQNYDYDMVMHVFAQSLFPGNEQIAYWHSSRADIPGGVNIAGIKNPAVDRLVEEVVRAKDQASLIAATRALDRVLLWNWYVIPNWHSRNFRIAYWDKFGRPKKAPIFNIGLDTWWDKSAEEK